MTVQKAQLGVGVGAVVSEAILGVVEYHSNAVKLDNVCHTGTEGQREITGCHC